MKYIEQHGAELATAAGVGIWGMILLNPFTDSFSVFSAAYKEMGRHATENEWGLFAFCVGILIFYGLKTGNKTLLTIGLSSAFAFRVFTLLFVAIQTRGTATGMGDFTLWSLIALYALYKVSNDA